MRKPRRSAATRTSSTSKRDLAPPDLRYQFLRAGPGRSPWALRGIAGGIGAGGALTLVLATRMHVFLFVAPFIALAVNGLFRGAARLLGPSKDFEAVPVAIVPWGVIIDPDRAPQPVPWPRLREVSFTRVDRDGHRNNDAVAVTIMLFDTDVGVVQAQGDDGEWASSIEAFSARFALSATRAPAADLAGTEALETGELPASLALVRRAEAILDSADGRSSLGLETGDYRTTSSRIAGPETRSLLRDVLWNDSEGLDPGPLAAILICELGISAMLPDLLRMILSTSPLLSATARATAVRLGASPVAAGSLDELEHFLPAEDIAELRRYSLSPSRRTAPK